MNKSQKQKLENMFYTQSLENMQNEERKQEKKKAKDREKRIKKANKEKLKEQEKFDLDTETVIGMTNKNNKIKRNQIQKEIDKQERIKQKRKKRIKKILKWLTLICIIIGGITFALVSPIFNIQEIQVTGNTIINADTIISLSQLSKQQNIFKFISKQVEDKVKENPYVEQVEIKRIFPNKVQIQVKERERNFNLEFMNGYAYINNQGYILEISENKLDLPIIQGAKTSENDIKPGNRLENQDLEKLETVMQIVNIWKTNNIEQKITSIDITDKTEYTMYIEEEKKKVYLGDKSNLGDKILSVQAIMNDNKGLEGEIYVNGDLNNKFKPRFKQKV